MKGMCCKTTQNGKVFTLNPMPSYVNQSQAYSRVPLSGHSNSRLHWSVALVMFG
jgi:hypothetical protein